MGVNSKRHAKECWKASKYNAKTKVLGKIMYGDDCPYHVTCGCYNSDCTSNCPTN